MTSFIAIYMYKGSNVHSTKPGSRATAPGQAALSDSTFGVAALLHRHEVEGRGIQWAFSLVVSKTTAIKPIDSNNPMNSIFICNMVNTQLIVLVYIG
jgi:hypothetical protein